MSFLFKYLAKNDLPGASNQSGFLVPKDWVDRGVLPQLIPDNPEDATAGQVVRLSWFLNDVFCGVVHARYQFQTRNLARSPEYRITGGLRPFLRQAEELDLIIVSGMSHPLDFRVELFSLSPDKLTRTARIFDSCIKRAFPDKRFGVIDSVKLDNEIGSDDRSDITEAVGSEYEEPLKFRFKTHEIKVREHRFRNRVLFVYQGECVVSGDRMRVPGSDAIEIEAAHIKPFAAKGPNDINNGIALSRRLHWSFDHGLWTIRRDSAGSDFVRISNEIGLLPEFEYLRNFHDQRIRAPESERDAPDPRAIQFHNDQVFEKFKDYQEMIQEGF